MDEPELKIIDVFICKLRKKLTTATEGENYIETVWGRGYVLRDPVPGQDALGIANERLTAASDRRVRAGNPAPAPPKTQGGQNRSGGWARDGRGR